MSEPPTTDPDATLIEALADQGNDISEFIIGAPIEIQAAERLTSLLAEVARLTGKREERAALPDDQETFSDRMARQSDDAFEAKYGTRPNGTTSTTSAPIRTASQNTAYIAQKLSHLEKGDPIGPPLERVPDEIDAVILGVIDALPAARRLFPDLYAWIVADAVREHLAALSTHPPRPSERNTP